MSITDDLAALMGAKVCKFGAVLSDIGDERAAVEQALADGVSASGLARVLTKNGHKIGPDVISAHRKNDCACVHQ